MSGETLEKLRRQCSSLNEAALSPEVKRQIIQDATSIARHGLTTENLCPNLTKLLQQCSKNRSLLYNFKHLPSEELLSREDMQLREMAKYLEENRESTSEKLEDDFIRINRRLLEEAFPEEIKCIYEERLKKFGKNPQSSKAGTRFISVAAFRTLSLRWWYPQCLFCPRRYSGSRALWIAWKVRLSIYRLRGWLHRQLAYGLALSPGV